GSQQFEKGSAGNFLGVASFGQRLDWLYDRISVGLNAKFGKSTLADYSAWTIASDFGVMYRMKLYDRPFVLGATVQNIGIQTKFKDETSPLPLGYRFGLSYQFIKCDWHNFLLASDIAKYKYGNYKLAFGAEYWFRNLLAVRGGYVFNEDDLGDLSFGMSIRVDAFNSGLQADYNQSDFGEALGYDMAGAISVKSVSPESFRLLLPQNHHVFCPEHENFVYWENSPDPDVCDVVSYRVLIDRNENKLKTAIEDVCKNSDLKVEIDSDQITEDTKIMIPEVVPGTYYWSVVAVDKNGHATAADEIRSFVKSAPDLKIQELAFLHSDTLPDFDDNYQGEIKIVIANSSSCPAYDFQVTLCDSFDCKQIKIPVLSFKVDSIDGRSVLTRNYEWRTDEIGKHYFSAAVDPQETVMELDDKNNYKMCTAVTVPRGRIYANSDTLDTKKIIYTYCEVPIIPFVFFEKESAEVSADFYNESWLYPLPPLKIIADRLKMREELKIELAGFLDPTSEAGNKALAQERMNRVRSIFVDSLDVPENRVLFRKNYDVNRLRVARSTNEMAYEENRRVEISVIEKNREDELALFGPKEMDQQPLIMDGIDIHADIRAYIDVITWQLLLKQTKTGKIVNRMPLNLDQDSQTGIDRRDHIVWAGLNYEKNIVPLNQRYSYIMKVEDKLGRTFYTRQKKFFVKCDHTQTQELQVHLNQFDSPKEMFTFNEDRLQDIANSLISSPEMRVKFNGYSCEIGLPSHNLNLAYNRAETIRNRFLKVLKSKYDELENPPQSWQQIVDRVMLNLTKEELKRKYAGHPGGYNEPLRYYCPCTLNEIFYSTNDAYVRNINRRVDIILFSEQSFIEQK
ncbi:hypothetical protein GF337_14540, partial [candidate division KSB1 bacterium]|nr:hypothetical protein [candidate division KSB1 bacterium]